MASTDTKKGATAKVGGKQLSWSQLVSKMGIDKARQQAPELDPEYQKLVASEGQAKGSEDYSHKFVDPTTGTSKLGWSGLGGGKEIDEGISDELNSNSPDLRQLGGIGHAIMHPASAGSVESTLGIKDAPAAPAAAAGAGKGGKAATPALTPAQQLAKQQQAIANSPATQLMNGLIGDYQTAIAANAPYMSGQAGENAVAKATGAAGVAVQDPGAESMLANDQAAVGKAATAGDAGVTTALQNMGTANAEALQVAPYQALLSSLQSEAQYKTETGTGAAAPSNSPAWYQQAMKDVGAGVTPAGLTTPATPTAASSPSSDNSDNIGGS